ncbi:MULTISPECIES: hypothetical protein [Bacillus]|uniref:hypothetical protein n=1 Tax=Bacillus TaxID=1386 RepID=UPI0023DAD4BA|nr:hypothetical protein [Bacillus pseudomycoides]MDF2086157.1 hypothetical protein [Bacillus pseudomycoides]
MQDIKNKKYMNPKENERSLRFEYARETVYEEDSGISKVLDVLIPEDELIDHDQRLFQIQHIKTELTWYTIHFEIRAVIEALRNEDYSRADSLMERIILLADAPYRALRVFVNTLTQSSLLRMRAKLPEGATGFDSPGMRNLKLVTKVLWKELVKALKEHGYTPKSFAILRSDTERISILPDRLALLSHVYDGIQKFDVKLMEWKQLHLRMVWGHLGGASAHIEESIELMDHHVRKSKSCPYGNTKDTDKNEDDFGIPTSLRGRPVTDLQRVTVAPFFPELWKIPDVVYQHMKSKNDKDFY